VQVACRGRIFGTDRIGRSGRRPTTSWSSVADLTRRRSTMVRSFQGIRRACRRVPAQEGSRPGAGTGAETNLPEWDGNVVNYDWAVGAMIGME
jgi:hypothetical protein